jgi:hypothetical protein
MRAASPHVNRRMMAWAGLEPAGVNVVGRARKPGAAKMSDKNPNDTKFVQIATSVQGAQILLYALDASGDVWRFDDKTHQWVRLPRERR